MKYPDLHRKFIYGTPTPWDLVQHGTSTLK